MDKFDLDLSLVARLGGHSQPRTHRGKERFPGPAMRVQGFRVIRLWGLGFKVPLKGSSRVIITVRIIVGLQESGRNVMRCVLLYLESRTLSGG